jgi:glycosyltransferase involved in cell wall biosynthesis
LAAGTPVVIDSNNHLALPVDACLCYNAPEDFLSIVNTVILNEENRQKQIDKNLETVRSKYSWNAVAQMYLIHF